MPKTIVPLTDTKIKTLKGVEGKIIKIADGQGLYFVLDKTGHRYWRLDYVRPYSKKRNSISLGDYPAISLAKARELRKEAQVLLSQNIDPIEERIRINDEILNRHKYTFKYVANEWLSKQNYAPSTLESNSRIIDKICETIGDVPIADIKVSHIMNVCKLYEKQKKIETAKKAKIKCGQILRYGVSLGLCERDLTQDLKNVLQTREVEHRPAITDPVLFGRFLKDLDNYSGHLVTQVALRILPLVFVRPGELRHAKWIDIDFKKCLWCYTPSKTRKKTGVQLIVPLSTQVIELLKMVEPLTRHKSEYVFPSMVSNLKPYSDNTLNKAMRRMDYATDEVTGHGCRATARTLLDEELHYPVEVIEMQLGHLVRDMHGKAYNRTQYLEKRREMMQHWADYCDDLKTNT